MNQAVQAPKSGMDNGSQMRITNDERALIQSVFRGNEKLLRLMRKMFLPEIDPEAPIGQLLDLWLTVDVRELSAEESKIRLLARNGMINHTDAVLMQLKLISEMTPMTPEQKAEKIAKDGSK